MSDQATKALQRFTSLARVWDDWYRVPILGWRIGLDGLVGLVPGLGDLAGALVGCVALLLAARAGVGTSILGRMLLNLAIDAAIGAVPLLGDWADFGWKAHRRNRELLERWLADPIRTSRRSAVGVASVAAATVGLIVMTGWLVVSGVRWLAAVS